MIDEDPRFPNRKSRDWEPPRPNETLNDAERNNPGGEAPAEEPLPVSSYRIVRSTAPDPGDTLPELELPEPILPSVEAPPQAPIPLAAPAERLILIHEAPSLKLTPREKWAGRIRKFAESPKRVIAAVIVGLGLLLGLAVAAVSWLTSEPAGRYDLQSVTSSDNGLTGHLFIQWDNNLKYRLEFKPSDPDLQAGFALAVANPQRPLSIDVHLQNSEGFVLCSREILLKYNPRSAVVPGASASASHAGMKSAGDSSVDQTAQDASLAQLNAQETAREQGKTVFQSRTGPDGQIAAIDAQGDFPCSKESYEKAVNWSFTSSFPSLAEQDQWLRRARAIEAGSGRPSPDEIAERKRLAAKNAAKLLPFSVEGDDAIVDFDVARGVIQTRDQKVFFAGKTSGTGAGSPWQDYPVSIHYRCDRSSDCVLMHSGAGALHAKLGR
jgi:hypothetical protein